MGEKPEEAKKPEDEAKPAAAAAAADEIKEDAPPPPPPEIVLKIFMHCEGCARKVRRCLKGFDGVEDIQTDCKAHKVIVKGEKADPMKVLERLQKKSHRKVELLSPVPQPPADEPKKPEEEPPKPEEKKEEVILVVLKVHMHCEACAQEIRKRILRMKGVESAEPDLKSSQVTVKGTFTAAELVDFVHKRIGKHAIIVKQDPEPKKPEDDKPKDDKPADADPAAETKEEKKAEDGAGADEGKEKEAGGEATAEAGGGDEAKSMEMKKNEFYYFQAPNYQFYPQRYAAETVYGYPPAPQMFSDENPNACSVM